LVNLKNLRDSRRKVGRNRNKKRDIYIFIEKIKRDIYKKIKRGIYICI